MLRVPIKTWYESRYGNPWQYVPYYDGNEETAMPPNCKYYPGDIVVIKEPGDKPCVGVVLGCIDHKQGELRTDARGMVSFDIISPVKTIAELKSYLDAKGITDFAYNV